MSASLLAHLQHGLTRIAKISPRVLESPPTQPRRASVALILHVRPAEEDEAWLRSKWRHGQVKDEDDAYLFPSTMQQDANGTMGVEARLRQFFALPWVSAVRRNCCSSSAPCAPMTTGRHMSRSQVDAAMKKTKTACTRLCARRGRKSASTLPRKSFSTSATSKTARLRAAWASVYL